MKPLRIIYSRDNSHVEAYTDMFIADYSTLYAVSIYGRQTAVRAISSALVTGKFVDIRDQRGVPIYTYITLGNAHNYRKKREILDIPDLGKVYHQAFIGKYDIILLQDGDYDDQGSLTENGQEKLFYAFDRQTVIPIPFEWNRDLYEYIVKIDGIKFLDSFGIDGKTIKLNYDPDYIAVEFLKKKGVKVNIDTDN